MARVIGKGYSYDDVLVIPKYNKIHSRKEVEFKTKVTKNYEINIPLIAANMDTICESEMAIAIGKMGGLGVIHRFLSVEKQVEEIKKVKNANLISAAAIGVKDYKERIEKLVGAGVNILVLDIAHGHSKRAGNVLDYIKKNYSDSNVDVMVGNIATKDAAQYFVSKGADGLKVGIGPGSMCTTRIMTGCGVPQLTAIMDVYEYSQGRIPLCADGGIKKPGDLVKAIGGGADTIMSGSIFSGCEETPGEIKEIKNIKYKEYRGMASYDATVKKLKIDGKEESEIISVEGEKSLVRCKGNVKEIVTRFIGGLASGMTYVGAKNIDEIKGRVDFIEISYAGMNESVAHGLYNKK
jgi:IMP dehydrogenase